MNIINFISNFENYDNEVSGRKPNTVRVLSFYREQKLKLATHLRIRRGYTKTSFIKKITDKTKWKNEWVVSWNPNSEVGIQLRFIKIAKQFTDEAKRNWMSI